MSDVHRWAREGNRVGSARASVAAFVLLAMMLLAIGTASNAASDEVPKKNVDPAVSDRKKAANLPKFTISEFRVLGNSVLPAVEIERVVYDFLGTNKTLDDVESARTALENLYHQRGFGTVFVDVPEQSVDEEIVRLRVTEGKLARTSTEGARYFSERQIRRELPEVSAGRVPNLPILQTELGAVNAVTSDRAVTPVLKAGATPGTVDLNLRVDDHLPFHGSLELNNQYTVDTSSLRALGTLSYDNLFGRADSVSFQYQASPQDTGQVSVLVANLTTHVGAERLALYFLHSNSNVATVSTGATIGGAIESTSLAIVGRGNAFGARFIIAVENTAHATQNFTLSAEYKDFLQAINPLGNPDPNNPSSAIETPIHYINVSADYAAFWRGDKVQQSLDTSINFGLRNIASSAGEFDNKRFEGRGNYFYLRSAYSLGVHLPADFTVLLKLAGQLAEEPLISNEQFSIAGADGVRGYLEAEELADRATKASLQLGSPRWKQFAERASAQAFVFYDIGRINVIDPLPEEPSALTLRSWGSGIDVSFWDHFTGSLTWARPLTDANVTHRGASRVLFSVRGYW